MPPFKSAMKSAISLGTSWINVDNVMVQPMVVPQLRNAAPIVKPHVKLCTW